LCGTTGLGWNKVSENAMGVSRFYLLNVLEPKINQIYGEDMGFLLAPFLLLEAFVDSVVAKNVMSSSLRKLFVDGFPEISKYSW
jgi:hypothetical protein